jgi:uracil phosphoribosyltransferase
MPYQDARCSTPIGETYHGKSLKMGLCAVPVIRAGESMEQEFKKISSNSPIGKILIQRDKLTKQPQYFYESFPEDISQRYILVMEPMLATGGSAIVVIERLIANGVPQKQICFANILSSPEGLEKVSSLYPEVTIVTSSIEKCLNPEAFMIPGIGDFGDRYFGTIRMGAENGQT